MNKLINERLNDFIFRYLFDDLNNKINEYNFNKMINEFVKRYLNLKIFIKFFD